MPCVGERFQHGSYVASVENLHNAASIFPDQNRSSPSPGSGFLGWRYRELEEWAALSSVLIGILAAVITGFVAWHLGERQVRIRNVTEERAKWRDRLRALAADLAAVPEDKPLERRKAAMGLRLLLNPYDELDRELVAILNRMEKDGLSPTDLQQFSLRLQLLLKHDWERAKREASWAGAPIDRARRLLRLKTKPARPNFNALRAWRSRNAINPYGDLPPE